MSLFCSDRNKRRDDDSREMSREHAVMLMVEVMKADPAWDSLKNATERHEIAARLVDTRRAVREGQFRDDI
jgi:hypothetical protein